MALRGGSRWIGGVAIVSLRMLLVVLLLLAAICAAVAALQLESDEPLELAVATLLPA